VRDRKFAGFSVSTTTAPDSAIGTYYDQGDTVDSSYGEQSDGYGQINHLSEKIYSTSQAISSNGLTCAGHYDSRYKYFVGLGRQVVEDFASDGSHRDKATDYFYSTTTDDLLQTVEYGEVTANPNGTFNDIGSDARATNYTYAQSTSTNLSVPVEKTSGTAFFQATSTATSSASVNVLVVAVVEAEELARMLDSEEVAQVQVALYMTQHTWFRHRHIPSPSAVQVPVVQIPTSVGAPESVSVFDTITAYGGGGGGSDWQPPSSGGSGGGGDASGSSEHPERQDKEMRVHKNKW